MAILKCKMCGGDIELSADRTFGTCDSCGSTMTFPKVDDEQRASRFNRGNHFRRQGEFDKALAVYERIVQEDENDAEAHWCCALCRFGIEYVEDPNTFEYLPTCHRASFDSFLEDVDYLAALEHSDGITKRQYQKDAAKIAEVQRGILATSQNEEPFDVFICYKESEADNTRTRDSLLAQEIYYQLTEQGRRVFFSRITLEDKAGTEYEPYIFAALNSAKVMIVVTTSAEHVNAVWVKNEWSRFLSLMRKDRSKLLLPCYRDMDPYDLPEALSVLQSYDMSKIGFIQDLTRGVNKVLNAGKPKETVKETVVVQQGNSNAAPLLKRAFMFLEDGDFSRADEFCEQVLNLDPENAEAYLGKLMAELKVKKRDDLKNQPQPFDDRNNYKKALHFGDAEQKQFLAESHRKVQDRYDDTPYQNALQVMKTARDAGSLYLIEKEYKNALNEFEKLGDYKDSKQKAEQCRELASNARKDRFYNDALLHLKSAEQEGKNKVQLLRIIKELETLQGWKDSEERIEQCRTRIEKMVCEEEKAAKKRKRTAAIVTLIVVACIAFVIVLFTVILPSIRYNKAVELYNAGQYEEAITAFEALNGYKDSDTQIETCENAIMDLEYNKAIVLYSAGNKEGALALFETIIGYKDSDYLCQSIQYEMAETLENDARFAEAAIKFGELGDFEDSRDRSKTLWTMIVTPHTISASAHTLGLRNDGTVIATTFNETVWGRYTGQCEVKSWKGVASLVAGGTHSVGLLKNGKVIATNYKGGYYDGQCETSEWTDIVDVAAGSAHTVALRIDGTVLAIGSNYWGQCNTSNWKDIISISAFSDNTAGLKCDGTVVAVGYNVYSPSWKNIKAISVGNGHILGLQSDGTVVARGNNEYGECDVSSWTDIVAISAGSNHSVGLKLDGTVVAVGDNTEGQCNISEWRDIVAVAAGAFNTVGLKADGTVVSTQYIGSSLYDYGQCDVSDWKDIKLPTKQEIY